MAYYLAFHHDQIRYITLLHKTFLPRVVMFKATPDMKNRMIFRTSGQYEDIELWIRLFYQQEREIKGAVLTDVIHVYQRHNE